MYFKNVNVKKKKISVAIFVLLTTTYLKNRHCEHSEAICHDLDCFVPRNDVLFKVHSTKKQLLR